MMVVTVLTMSIHERYDTKERSIQGVTRGGYIKGLHYGVTLRGYMRGLHYGVTLRGYIKRLY